MWFEHNTGLWRSSDPPSQHHYPGGVYWDTRRRYRTSNTAAGVIHLALLLYSQTHNRRRYLGFAEHLYAWTRWALGTRSGRYRAQIGPGGLIHGSALLSTDAVMVSNGMMLYADTHGSAYRAQAEQTARAAARQYSLAQIEDVDPAYDSMYFYNTQRFSRATLGAYVRYMRARVAPKTGLVRWRHPFDTFPRGGCVGSFYCRQQQAAQAGVVGVMTLWDLGG